MCIGTNSNQIANTIASGNQPSARSIVPFLGFNQTQTERLFASGDRTTSPQQQQQNPIRQSNRNRGGASLLGGGGR